MRTCLSTGHACVSTPFDQVLSLEGMSERRLGIEFTKSTISLLVNVPFRPNDASPFVDTPLTTKTVCCDIECKLVMLASTCEVLSPERPEMRVVIAQLMATFEPLTTMRTRRNDNIGRL